MSNYKHFDSVDETIGSIVANIFQLPEVMGTRPIKINANVELKISSLGNKEIKAKQFNFTPHKSNRSRKFTRV